MNAHVADTLEVMPTERLDCVELTTFSSAQAFPLLSGKLHLAVLNPLPNVMVPEPADEADTPRIISFAFAVEMAQENEVPVTPLPDSPVHGRPE